MFSTEIVGSDAFMTMPKSAQLLYFHFGCVRDNDGFIGNPLSTIRLAGCSKKDYQTLIERRFILEFASGVCVIKHHWINNTKRRDRYQPTKYQDELALLCIKANGAYSEKNKPTTSNGMNSARTRQEIHKDSCRNITKHNITEQNKNSIARAREFIPPSLQDVQGYVDEKGYEVDAREFWSFYGSKGWMVGKNKMKDWRLALAGWHSRTTTKTKPEGRREDEFEWRKLPASFEASKRQKAL